MNGGWRTPLTKTDAFRPESFFFLFMKFVSIYSFPLSVIIVRSKNHLRRRRDLLVVAELFLLVNFLNDFCSH